MPFFFSKKPSSVAQDMYLAEGGAANNPVESFEVELLGHLDTLYGVSCRMTKSTAEAEDLVQDTVVKAMRAMRDPETQALSPLVEAEVQRALDDLPDEFRLAVVLSDIEELSYKEIADAMGCPIGTVMSRLHRGRRMLQKTLREQAVAMGIVSEEVVVARDDGPADLAAFRRRKRGAA